MKACRHCEQDRYIASAVTYMNGLYRRNLILTWMLLVLAQNYEERESDESIIKRWAY